MQQPSQGSVATLKSVANGKSVIFTSDVEAEIVEWIKDHPEFYDKNSLHTRTVTVKVACGRRSQQNSTQNAKYSIPVIAV